eukprot:CAMPEP_0113544108 /NCGR_PEP_ID=MMETSP0015_2-20120614/10528_1 /TAXON_ID=2838 /ORGANISM="Odontella" /LENGTH=87 /DNA_ID=CAMNT_0000444337 /DNA_START=100 /DNA_END=361 /DNA_ORIENTATION=- /assembly_acc=CAM_ASM_000160
MTVYSGARVVFNVDAALACGKAGGLLAFNGAALGGPIAFNGAAAGNVGGPLVFDGAAQPGVSGATDLGEWEVIEGAATSLGDSSEVD